MSKVKLLLWSPNGSGLDYGGPGMTAYRLFNANRTEKLSIALAHGRKTQKQYDLFEKMYYFGEIQSGFNEKLNFFNQMLFLRKAKKWVRDNAENFDVFYGLQGFHVTVLPAMVAQENNLPAILKLVQNNSDLSDKTGFKKLFNAPKKRREMIHKLSGIVSISSLITKELLEMGYPEEKIVYIPNGVDTDQFYPDFSIDKAVIKKKLGWKDRPTILFVGAIIERKQPHLLIEVMNELKKQGEDVQIVFAGPEKQPSYSLAMKHRISDLGLDSSVIWQGFSSSVSELYRAADIFSLLSNKEGMPNVLLEAMASGLPSLVTRVSGVDDIITNGVNGFVVGKNVQEVTSICIELLRNSELDRMVSKAACERITEEFSSDIIFEKQLNVFSLAAKGKPICG